jgi:hypothetical protein
MPTSCFSLEPHPPDALLLVSVKSSSVLSGRLFPPSDSYRPVVGYLLREEGLSGAGRLYVRADVSFGTEDDGGRTC